VTTLLLEIPSSHAIHGPTAGTSRPSRTAWAARRRVPAMTAPRVLQQSCRWASSVRRCSHERRRAACCPSTPTGAVLTSTQSWPLSCLQLSALRLAPAATANRVLGYG